MQSAISASSATACFSERPKRTSRCDEWSRPPWWIGRPSSRRGERDESRVENRHREHEHGQDERRDGRAGDAPARGEAERGEREAERLAAGVAHEDERPSPGPQVEREEAEAGGRAGEREAEVRVTGCWVTASTAKKANAIAASVAASPSMLSSRLNAFEMPISHTTAIASAITSLWTIWTCVPVAEHDRRRTALGGELRRAVPGAEEIVGEPGEEDERDPGVDADEPRVGGEDADRGSRPDADAEAGEDADPADDRGRLVVPPVGRGQRNEPPGRARPEQGPDHDCGSRQGDHRHGGAHRR